jgi:hypothetical protein
MSNTASPLTIQGEEIQVGSQFWDGRIGYIVTYITQAGSIAFSRLDGIPQTTIPFEWLKKWLEPPSKKLP